jgi:hypothetical protein
VTATFLVAAALAAACGDDGSAAPSGLDPGQSASTPAPPNTDTSVDGAPTTAAGAEPVGGPGTTAGAGSPTTVATAPDTVLGVGSLRVGQLAPAILRPGRGDRVVLEVRAQQGAGPAAATVDHLARVLGDASGKPVGVDGIDALDGGARDWTAREIVAAASAAAQAESGRTQVAVRLLFLRGTFEGDTGVLGVAVAGDVAAVFSDRVDAAAGLLVPSEVVEDAVAMHELGHLLGLVDLVLATGRADPDHAGHSRNRGSVMYWQVESGLITQLLDGGIPRDFDADDRADLAAIRRG